MDKIVYALCAVTSGACAALLLRGYRQTGMRLLLWSMICFACLTVSNVFVYVDLIMLPDVDLVAIRDVTTIAGLSFLIYGMVWETV